MHGDNPTLPFFMLKKTICIQYWYRHFSTTILLLVIVVAVLVLIRFRIETP